MSETISMPTGLSKQEKYDRLFPQIKALIADEPDFIANLANVAAALKEVFHFWWVGFYLVRSSLKKDSVGTSSDASVERELVLGPFQGPVACTRIALGRGVCGSAWKQNKILIVPDVDQFPGHIACSSASRSEIVIPLVKRNASGIEEVIGVLDVDSEHLDHFDEVDAEALQKVLDLL